MARTRANWMLASAVMAVLAWGCSGGSTPTASHASPRPSTGPGASTSPVAATHGAVVLGLDGRPASGVAINAYVVGGDVKAPLQTVTDAAGHFALTPPAGAVLVVEAVQGPTVKAIALDVKTVGDGFTLQLAQTGTITGRVVAPEAPGVTDFSGVTVSIPHTPYMATTGADGHFSLEGVPVGTFALAAGKAGLGQGNADAVKVITDLTTPAPDIALGVEVPAVSALSPVTAAVGSEVTLTGANFGASENKALKVTVGGVAVASPTRVDDQTIRFTVPDGVGSGDVVVTVGQVQGAGVPVAIATTLTLAGNDAELLSGDTRPYAASLADQAGQVLDGASVTWTADGALSVDATGRVTGKSAGPGTLHAAVGALKADLAITVETTLARVSTIAGAEAGHADGPGPQARFSDATGLALSGHTLIVAEPAANCLRAVDLTTNAVTTLAGSATGARGGTDGPAASARFDAPTAVAVDATGFVYVADANNRRIRKLDTSNPDAPTVSTIVGVLSPSPAPVQGGSELTNGPGASATLVGPGAIALDAAGRLLVGDGPYLRRVDLTVPARTVSTFASKDIYPGVVVGGTPGLFDYNYTIRSLAVEPDGSVFVGMVGKSGANNNFLYHVAADGHAATLVAKDAANANVPRPLGLLVDPAGGLEVSLAEAHGVFRLAADGTLTGLAGPKTAAANQDAFADGVGAAARFAAPAGLVRDADGTLYAADGSRLRKIAIRTAQ